MPGKQNDSQKNMTPKIIISFIVGLTLASYLGTESNKVYGPNTLYNWASSIALLVVAFWLVDKVVDYVFSKKK